MYGVIDIGSNTIRLVIYRVEDGEPKAILNNKYTAGLAGYVDKKNCLTAEGIARLVDVLREFRIVLSLLPECTVYPFATASLRNIVNTEHVLTIIQRETGFNIHILSGYEEAMLDYRGAICHAQQDSGLMVDIGGGSTELVFFKERAVMAAHSIPLGSLNLYSNFVGGLMPDKDELKQMSGEVQRVLATTLPPAKAYIAQPLCGVGGTARATCALYRKTVRDFGDEPEYAVSFLIKVLRQAVKNPRKLMRNILKIAPERVHTLVPGIVILYNIVELYGSKTIITSSYGVRDGYLAYMLEKERGNCD